jgi:UDP-N-acetylmuramyl pentapeptide phosphotransferase/UDP-N-acetylglucosamine-1-phosphate transferase
MLVGALLGAMVALVATAAFTRYLIGYLRASRLLDVPNERSSHSVPTPRGAGIAIIAGALAGVLLQVLVWDAALPAAPFWISLGGVAAVGWVDDRYDLSPGLRLALQGLCAAVAVSSGCLLSRLPTPAPLDLPVSAFAGWGLSWLWLVGMTNIFNFLDGIDGYAAVQAVIACAALLFMQLSPALTPVLVAVAGGCLGFLLYNWHPAKIFMGDVGSTTLGFLIALTPLQAGDETRHFAVLMTALTVWFFVTDGAYTLIRRALRGERVWKPHRTHLYQLYAAAGYRHDHVVIRLGLAAAALATLATISYHARHSGLSWLVVLLAVLSFAVYRRKVEAMSGNRRPVTG